MALTFKTGDLRHRVIIQRVNEAQNDTGEIVQSWATYVSAWCQILPLSGSEFIAARQANAEVTHTIKCRYYRGITPRMRILYGSRVFEILAVMNWGERNEELRIMAKETV
jgi:SPP1 family predicted phage head-tail adaptor